MTITISSTEPSTIDRVLAFLRHENVPFVFQNEVINDDTLRTTAIRERLRLKYVLTGEWAIMTDEERLDASLFEGMSYDDDMNNVEVLTEAEQTSFRAEMKNWAKQ